MLIADAHADSLMWNRDLNTRSRRGHVDFPRLREAGVKLQCFTLVTEGFPYVDGFGLFAAWQGWPAEARRGPWARAQFQIDALERACEASQGQAIRVRYHDELAPTGDGVHAVLGIEGAQVLEGRVKRVSELHARGVRFIGLTHLRDNTLGGTSHFGGRGVGLSVLGQRVVDAMASLRMAVDVAHASPALLEDLFARRDVSLFCSHTGAGALASPWRNLSDDALRRLADRGGVAGIIYGTPYLGGGKLDDVARHIEHAVSTMGSEAVALGSDFDGMVPLPRGMADVTDVPRVLERLSARGMASSVVEKVAGTNLIRFVTGLLPTREPRETGSAPR